MQVQSCVDLRDRDAKSGVAVVQAWIAKLTESNVAEGIAAFDPTLPSWNAV